MQIKRWHLRSSPQNSTVLDEIKSSLLLFDINSKPFIQWWAKWRLSTFDLYPWGEGHGVQGQICDIRRSQLAMNRFLPLWPHRFPHFGYIHLVGGGGGALILDRCQAFDLFASVDAHLCFYPWKDIVGKKVSKLRSIAELRAFYAI
jgi:hypothetical protein